MIWPDKTRGASFLNGFKKPDGKTPDVSKLTSIQKR